MKKVAVLTFHDTTNFGATLQAVATYTVLKELGFDVDILDYRCTAIDKRELPPGKYNFKQFSLGGFILFLFCNKKYWRKYYSLHDFLLKHVTLSQKVDHTSIIEIENEYDLFLVGSDMLWCMKNTNNDYTYLLDFVEDPSKKYAYATSMGYEPVESEKRILEKYLADFSGISVRERGLACVLESLLKRNISRVCDPTMLINSDYWRNYVQANAEKKYVFVYMDRNDGLAKRNALEYAKERRINVYVSGFDHPFRRDKRYKVKELYSITDFLSAIYNAEILYTASYHGMLFAIYFHIPFVYYNKDASRLEEVAADFGLQDRNGEVYDHMKMPDIDWKSVDVKREKFASDSYGILKEMISA